MAAWNPKANEIFLKAVDIPAPDDRRAYLDEACQGNAQLRVEVESLITAGQQAGSFLESPAPGLTAAVDICGLNEQVGSVIGPYKLLEQIGEGGMGVVFMAEQQEPVRRKVAVKLIKPGMDTRQVIARFEAERQALAVMDHPSIARVLDAGTTPSGHPYFVMELVRGVPVTTYCDENNLSVRERLELFASVCHAIQHAHTKGIIHRDIKPSNVLITRQDGRPAVKVIDFGVAKAMGQQLTEKTLFTNFAQMIGTPLYMSPEQAEQSGVDIDTRSDIYSLGVLLYELLTGSTPVDAAQLNQAAFDEIRRIIREDEPPTPSARISGSHTLPAIAAHRHIEPARLSRLLRGELDWIVMKALEKDRGRRYETANGFAADLLHYLNDEPVHACPPSATYRFGKFARRNRVALTTATLVAAALMVGTIVSTWQAIRAETARKAEAAQRSVAEAARTAEAKQRQVAETQQAESEKQRAQSEANFQRARQTVDKYFTLVSESRLLDVPGLQPLRKELLDSALEFYKTTAAERTSDPSVLADVAVTYLRVAQIDHAIGRNNDSVTAMASALDVVDRLRGDYPNQTEHHRRVAGFWKGYRPQQGVSEMPTNPVAAFRTLQRAIKTWQELVDKDPDHLVFQSDLASLCYLTGLLMATVNERESLRYYERSRGLLEKLVVAQPDVPEHRADLARVDQDMVGKLSRVGRKAEADTAESRSLSLREELVAQYPDSAQLRGELAIVLCRRAESFVAQQPAKAEEMYQRGVDLSLALVCEFPEVSINYEVLATTLRDWGKYALSGDKPTQRERFQKIVQDLESRSGPGIQGANVAVVLVMSYVPLAESQTGQDKLRSIRNFIAACHNAIDDTHGLREAPATSPQSERILSGVHRPMDSMAKMLGSLSQFPESVEVATEFIEVSEKLTAVSKNGHWRLAHTCRWLGLTPGHEKEYARKSIAAFERCIADQPTRTEAFAYLADTLNGLGQRLSEPDEAAEAESCFRRARDIYDKLKTAFPTNREYHTGFSSSYSNLMKILRAQRKHDEVERILATMGDDVQMRILRGTLYRESGDVDQAIADFSWVIDKEPKRVEAWDLRGNCYLQKSRLDKMVEDYTKAIELQPSTAWYWHERGFAYLLLGEHEKSVADHSRSIELGDHDPGQRLRRGNSYRALGELEKAEADYVRAIELNPADWECWFGRGALWAEQGQPDKAQADFTRAVDLCARNADALNNLAWRFATSADLKVRNASLAVGVAKKGIELDPKNVQLPNTLGVAHYRAGNWQDAIDALNKSIEVRNGGDSFDWFFLAMAHWQQGNQGEAREWYAKAVEWMEANQPKNRDLQQFRSETEELIKNETTEPQQKSAVQAEARPSP